MFISALFKRNRCITNVSHACNFKCFGSPIKEKWIQKGKITFNILLHTIDPNYNHFLICLLLKLLMRHFTISLSLWDLSFSRLNCISIQPRHMELIYSAAVYDFCCLCLYLSCILGYFPHIAKYLSFFIKYLLAKITSKSLNNMYLLSNPKDNVFISVCFCSVSSLRDNLC